MRPDLVAAGLGQRTPLATTGRVALRLQRIAGSLATRGAHVSMLATRLWTIVSLRAAGGGKTQHRRREKDGDGQPPYERSFHAVSSIARSEPPVKDLGGFPYWSPKTRRSRAESGTPSTSDTSGRRNRHRSHLR